MIEQKRYRLLDYCTVLIGNVFVYVYAYVHSIAAQKKYRLGTGRKYSSLEATLRRLNGRFPIDETLVRFGCIRFPALRAPRDRRRACKRKRKKEARSFRASRSLKDLKRTDREHVYAHAVTRTRASTHLCQFFFFHTRIHTRTHTHTCTHIHTYIHTFLSRSSSFVLFPVWFSGCFFSYWNVSRFGVRR